MRPRARRGLLMTMLLMAGCMSTRSAGGADGADGAMATLAGTAWRLEELNGRPASPIGEAGTPTLMFGADGARSSGNGGCNQFSGPYTQAGASLRFGALVSTRRACVDPAGNSQESAYLQALQSTTRHAVSGDSLVLYAAGQAVARFSRSSG